MRIYFSLLFAIAAIFLIGACSSSDSSSSSTSPTVTATGQDISGTWSKSCTDETTESFITTLVISGTTGTFTVPVYLGVGDCSGGVDFQFDGTFTFDFIDEVTLASGEAVSRTDVTDTAETLTPMTSAGAADLNSGNLYGISTWTVGTAEDINALDEMGNTRTEFTEKDLVFFDDSVSPNTLQLGVTASSGGTLDADMYPDTLEAETFAKQ